MGINREPKLSEQIHSALAILPPMQARFALAYSQTGNATKSAQEAGYSERSLASLGCNLAKSPVVQNAVTLLRQQYAETAVWNAEDKMQKLQDIADKASQEGDNYSPSVSVQAIREHNAMTGDLAAIQVKHNHLNVDMKIVYDINMPKRGTVHAPDMHHIEKVTESK